MERESFEPSLHAFVRRVPFQPFTVELITGVKLPVDQPESLVVRANLAMYVASDGNMTLFDQLSMSRITTEPEHWSLAFGM